MFERPRNQNTEEANRLRQQERARNRRLDEALQKAKRQGLLALLRIAALEVLPHVLLFIFLFSCLVAPFLHLGGSVFLAPAVPRGYAWQDGGGYALSILEQRVDEHITHFISKAAADLCQEKVTTAWVEKKPVDLFSYYEAMLPWRIRLVQAENKDESVLCFVCLLFNLVLCEARANQVGL